MCEKTRGGWLHESSGGGAGQLCAPSTVLAANPRTQEREGVAWYFTEGMYGGGAWRAALPFISEW